jgi:uncharacterized Ntn-hydrolase superfamily protein
MWMSRARSGHAGAALLLTATLLCATGISGAAAPPPHSGETTISTFSIVAVDSLQGEWGVAVASRFLAVGSVVPWAQAGVGAAATQALANSSLGSRALTLLSRGRSAPEALQILLRADDRRGVHQIGIVDGAGHAATHTGKLCDGWAGGMRGVGFCVQGNTLVGKDVVEIMAEAFQATPGSLADRLLAALAAGEGAGGDRRGRQSAALLIAKARGGYLGEGDRYVDLRVDDAERPVEELQRLYDLLATTRLPAVHSRLGDEALAVSDRAGAEREYARVVKLYRDGMARHPENASLRNGLAWFYVQHRVNLDEASALVLEALRLDPDSWEIRDTLAQIHFTRGQFDQARDEAQRALALDPNNAYLKRQVARFETAIAERERR